jgi:hypothetical protein
MIFGSCGVERAKRSYQIWVSIKIALVIAQASANTALTEPRGLKMNLSICRVGVANGSF